MLNSGGPVQDDMDPRTQQEESRMKMKIVDVNRVRSTRLTRDGGGVHNKKS